MAKLPIADMTKYLNMTPEDLQMEANATAQITAQLKRQETSFLQDRTDLRNRLTVPPAPDDAEVQADIARISGSIVDNERELALS